MSIDYRKALDRRDEFVTYLHKQITDWVDADATPEDVLTVAEILLKEGWVLIDE